MIVDNDGGKPKIPNNLKEYFTGRFEYVEEIHQYKIWLSKEYYRQKIKEELRKEMNDRVQQIADVIESGKQGKELADEIRKRNKP